MEINQIHYSLKVKKNQLTHYLIKIEINLPAKYKKVDPDTHLGEAYDKNGNKLDSIYKKDDSEEP